MTKEKKSTEMPLVNVTGIPDETMTHFKNYDETISYGIYALCSMALVAFAVAIVYCLCGYKWLSDCIHCRPCKRHTLRPLNLIIHEATIEEIEESTHL